MRLARLVAAGLLVGAVLGFAVELLRPRRDLRTSVPQRPEPTPPPVAAQQPRPAGAAPREGGRHRAGAAHVDGPALRVPDQPGADLPTRPVPLPGGTALTGTGGTR